MRYIKTKLAISVMCAMSPMLALAATEKDNLLAFLQMITTAMGMLVPIFTGLALVYFIYGLAEHISDSGNEAKKAEGRNKMIYGTIALFCIVSVWGIVTFVRNTIGVTDRTEIPSPKIPK